MEGVLYKWTNYISGWQPRWFVLSGGTLSYYDSQEDAWKGCKGSIKIAVCEIQVHLTDFTRVDLIIPGEQFFYLRAINAAERQKWLVALGTAKACLTDNRTKREKEFQENTETLKTKMSELRLYCDLLMEQVNKLKENPRPEGGAEQPGDDGGNMVKSTCTTFLTTLEECMQIASRTFNPDLQGNGAPRSPSSAGIRAQKIKAHDQRTHHQEEKQKRSASSSVAENLGYGPDAEPLSSSPAPPTGNSIKMKERDDPDIQNTLHSGPGPEHHEAEAEENVSNGNQSQEQPACSQYDHESRGNPEEEEEEERVETFFSSMSHRFSDIKLEEDGGIPTRAFLDSCYAIVPVLDKLGPTVFAPVKMDFVGNIKKVQQKLLSDEDGFPTLQSIVLHEVHTEVARVRNSATEALLWLKRGLKFLKEFLSELDGGEQDVHAALNNAYGKTLRQYHGWVVRGVFALALRAAPSYGGFMAALVCHEGDELKDGFVTGMHRDLTVYLPAMEKQLASLDALYEEYGLESDEVV
ncbi:pleckstrin homology domain-containing family A member 8 isoform X2 [Trichomycterus rosablanca]|uniref:pleckstrin homology domain-containing family A member 8 isoform X2 n=1 Tax=Trichomycterus rosablanca TaxID=2290929 RepID=UPI002F3524A0